MMYFTKLVQVQTCVSLTYFPRYDHDISTTTNYIPLKFYICTNQVHKSTDQISHIVQSSVVERPGLERENILSPCYCHQISTMLCLLLRLTMDSSCEICSIAYFTSTREGHGAMFRVWRSADVAACRAVWNPAWCRIFREISCFSPLNLGALLKGPLGMRHFQCCQF